MGSNGKPNWVGSECKTERRFSAAFDGSSDKRPFADSPDSGSPLKALDIFEGERAESEASGAKHPPGVDFSGQHDDEICAQFVHLLPDVFSDSLGYGNQQHDRQGAHHDADAAEDRTSLVLLERKDGRSNAGKSHRGVSLLVEVEIGAELEAGWLCP